MTINLLKSQNESVVQDDHEVLKIVVHESVPQSMKVSSIITAPLRQEQQQRRLVFHNTQTWTHKISSTTSSSGEYLIFAQNFTVQPRS